MTPKEVLFEIERLKQVAIDLARDKHQFAIDQGWECQDYPNGDRLYTKMSEWHGREIACNIFAVIAHEADWANPKCYSCEKRVAPNELDEVGFCNHCAINAVH